MRVRHAQHVEHALDRAVFAAAAVQRVEDHVGQGGDSAGDDAAKIARPRR